MTEKRGENEYADGFMESFESAILLIQRLRELRVLINDADNVHKNMVNESAANQWPFVRDILPKIPAAERKALMPALRALERSTYIFREAEEIAEQAFSNQMLRGSPAGVRIQTP